MSTVEKIENLYGVRVIALVGSNTYVVMDKTETARENNMGHRSFETNIHIGEVTKHIDGSFSYECVKSMVYLYDMEDENLIKCL